MTAPDSRSKLPPTIMAPSGLPGAMLATVFLKSAKSAILRKVFALVGVVLAIEMIYNGLTGRFLWV